MISVRASGDYATADTHTSVHLLTAVSLRCCHWEANLLTLLFYSFLLLICFVMFEVSYLSSETNIQLNFTM